MKLINLDQLLDGEKPLTTVEFNSTPYEVWDPDNMPEGARLRFYSVKAEIADLYERAQGQMNSVSEPLNSIRRTIAEKQEYVNQQNVKGNMPVVTLKSWLGILDAEVEKSINQASTTKPPSLKEMIMFDHDQLPLMRRWVEALCQMPEKALDGKSGRVVKKLYKQLAELLPVDVDETEDEKEANKNGATVEKNEPPPESNLETTSSKS